MKRFRIADSEHQIFVQSLIRAPKITIDISHLVGGKMNIDWKIERCIKIGDFWVAGFEYPIRF